MKFLAVFAVVLAVAAADVSHLDQEVPIVRSSYDSNADGSYSYLYETGNGIAASADGILKNANSETPVSEVRGTYSYTSPDGTPVQVNYIANENGFQPEGVHLPVGPAIPEAIARSLRYLAEHPPKPESAQVAGKY